MSFVMQWKRRVRAGGLRATLFLSSILLASVLSFVAPLSPQAFAASQPQKTPVPSGFFDSANAFASDSPGTGSITKAICTDGTSFSGNVRMNCDSTNLPHNELSIAVDPSNPNHIVAGSNDYEYSFQGSSIIYRANAGYYTSFDGGATWTNGHVPTSGFEDTGDPAIAFNQKLGLVHYGIVASNGGQRAGFAAATVQVSSSTDGGSTFGRPVTVALGVGSPTTSRAVLNDKPFITVDNNPSSPFYGRLYVTWSRFLFDQSGSYLESPIYLSHSDDGGRTFSNPVQISGSSSTLCSQPAISPRNIGICNEDQFSSPAVAPDGTVYVAFENEEHPQSPAAFRDQYLVVKSTNGGLSFSSPISAVFPVYDGINDYPINVVGRQTLSNSQFRVNSAGNLAVDPNTGQLYIAFSDNRNGILTGSFSTVVTNTDVFIVTSTNQGASWGIPVQVPGGAGTQNDQFYPWVAVDNAGVVRVAFSDRSYDPANVKYGETMGTSVDHGVTFTSIRVDTGLSNPDDSRWETNGGTTNGEALFIGDYNGLAIGSNGISHPAWTDMRVAAFPSPPPGRGHNTEDAFTASV